MLPQALKNAQSVTGAARLGKIQQGSGLLLPSDKGGVGFRLHPRGGAFNSGGGFRLLGEAQKELVVL